MNVLYGPHTPLNTSSNTHKYLWRKHKKSLIYTSENGGTEKLVVSQSHFTRIRQSPD